MIPFAYPSQPHSRRHGPYGYADYSNYRDWVRDEFTFRCVYCLKREVWLGGESAFFHIDHFVSQSQDPDLKTQYENLVYSCAACNGYKQDAALPDPCTSAFSECVEVQRDGTIIPKNREGRRLIRVLRLDSPDQVGYRQKMIALSEDINHRRQWLCYPRNLPDLRQKRVRNSRPAGVDDCFFVRRERGVLEETY